jgi:Flp pilus assembly protein TadG
MRKLFLILTGIALFTLTTANAVELEIQQNGESSSNSISVQKENTTTIHQGGSIKIDNTIDAKASTGNNTVSGNTQGNTTIKTGDATVDINVNTKGNSNSVHPATKTKHTPTITPLATITPTHTPSSGSSNQPNSSHSPPSSGTSGSNNEGAGIGGGEVKGLAATNSIDKLSLLSSVAGFICLVIGSALVSRRGQ